MKPLIKEASAPQGPDLIRIVSVRRTPTQTAPCHLCHLSKARVQGAASCRCPCCPLLPSLGSCLLNSASYTFSPLANVCSSPSPARIWGHGTFKPSGTLPFLQLALQLCIFQRKMESIVLGLPSPLVSLGLNRETSGFLFHFYFLFFHIEQHYFISINWSSPENI